jgi:general stress protein 26
VLLVIRAAVRALFYGDLPNAEYSCRALTSPGPIVRSCSPITHGECDGAVLTHAGLLDVMRTRRYAVQCSVDARGAPQSAVVGVAVSDDFGVVFDTLATSRKAQNLRGDPRIAVVFGSLDGPDQRTVQYEGMADEPVGAERDRVIDLYLSVFPDGRERQTWPNLTYFRVVPRWLRYSDYNCTPAEIMEFDDGALRRLT